MFSVMSVCPWGKGVEGSHATTSHDGLDLTVQGPPVTGDLCKLVRFRIPSSPTVADIRWLLKHIWSAQAGGIHLTGALSCFHCLAPPD